jgi:hypothetical protein
MSSAVKGTIDKSNWLWPGCATQIEALPARWLDSVYTIPMTITETKNFLARAHSITEWDQRVELVKQWFHNELPDFWQAEIIDSGFAEGQRLSYDSQLQKRKDEV